MRLTVYQAKVGDENDSDYVPLDTLLVSASTSSDFVEKIYEYVKNKGGTLDTAENTDEIKIKMPGVELYCSLESDIDLDIA